MKWVVVDRLHLNTDRIEGFHWMEDTLCIRFAGNDAHIFRKDPERKKYLRLCGQLGVSPVEDDEDGEK